jgi:hypothetical protein
MLKPQSQLGTDNSGGITEAGQGDQLNWQWLKSSA